MSRPKSYQPALEPQQIKALYYLKLRTKRPMTHLVREAVDRYLQRYGGIASLIPANEECRRTACRRCGRSYR